MLTLVCYVIGDMQRTCNVVCWKYCTVIRIGSCYVLKRIPPVDGKFR